MKFVVSTAFSDPDHLVPIARAADEHGYHGVAVSDHLIHPQNLESPYPYTEDGSPRWEPFTSWPDPWVAIGAMAAATQRLRFVTSVYVLPLRNPFVVAKAVSTAAVLSGNRVDLGVGMGWMQEEFRLAEQPFAARGKRADEMIEVIAKLTGGGWVEYHGEFYDFDPVEMSPTPSKPIPVYVGGLSERALRRAARNDGWIADIAPTDVQAEHIDKIMGFRRELGRADEPFELLGAVNDAADVEGYRRAEQAGFTQLMTMPWVFYSGFTDDLDAKLDGIAQFAKDILPHFA